MQSQENAVKRGIILAGGAGSRIYPLSLVASKQLLPVYDKPMIYYPLSALMSAGTREILIVSTPVDIPRFQDLLGDGSRLGIALHYRVQEKPEGIAQVFLLAEDFIQEEPVCLMLGDNLFYGKAGFNRALRDFTGGAVIFGYRTHDPERYGVLAFDEAGNVTDIVEKPEKPPSPYAVVGFYIYDGTVAGKAKRLRPSARGELEITDLNRLYLAEGGLSVEKLGRDVVWLDTGTPRSLQEASHLLATIEERQGMKLACIEEVALNMGFIGQADFQSLVADMPCCAYSAYLKNLIKS